MERVRLKIYGRVQGVFFRANTQKEATRLRLKGWVRNTEDGAVETEAEGEKKSLETFVAWCRKGPSSAEVSKVEVFWGAALGTEKGFNIRY